MADELLNQSATALGELIGTRQVSPVEVTERLLEYAHAENDVINAYVSFRDDAAMAEAKRAEQEISAGEYRGPLHGVPMALKHDGPKIPPGPCSGITIPIRNASAPAAELSGTVATSVTALPVTSAGNGDPAHR
ncbi:amidase family protein [Gordonia iterans]